MSKMFIISDGEAPLEFLNVIENVIDLPDYEVNSQNLSSVISFFEDATWQGPLSIYETDPEMATHADESTRECFLFGMAFEDQWCKDDVYIVMVHESGRAWVRHY